MTLRAHLERKDLNLLGTENLLRRARRFGGTVETVLQCTEVENNVQNMENNVRYAESRSEIMNVDLDEYYYWVQVIDEITSPATEESVRAVLGVSLIRS